MEAIRLTETANSPTIVLDKETNEFMFTGRSLPENPKVFYTPIFDWFDNYFEDPNSETNVVFEIEYMNTASSKMLLDLFRKFRKAESDGINIRVKWIYDEDDEEVLEAGSDFAEMTNVKFDLVSKKVG